MAYIKNEPTYKVGNWYLTTKEHESLSGKFTIGSYVEIIGFGPRGYDIRDENENTMIEIGWEL